MNPTTKLILSAAVAGLSLSAFAADPGSTTREQRMDEALQNYRSGNPNADAKTTPASSDSAFKRGVARTESAVERGASAVRRGLDKTGDAIHRTGNKISDKIKGDKDKTTN